MNKVRIGFIGHLAELRFRIEQLQEYPNNRFYGELRDLVLWIRDNPKFNNAIRRLEEDEVIEYKAVLVQEVELYGFSRTVWNDITNKLADVSSENLDDILSMEQKFKVENVFNKLTTSFSLKSGGFHSVNQLRMLIQGLAKSQYGEIVNNYVLKEGVLTGPFQEKYRDYADELEKYKLNKDRTFWGGWLTLKWVYDEPSVVMATRLLGNKEAGISMRERDILCLRRLGCYLFDYYNDVRVKSKRLTDDPVDLRDRVWDEFSVNGETLSLGEHGQVVFDPKRRHDGETNRGGTDSAKLLREIVSGKLEGFERNKIQSVKRGEISGVIQSINRTLLSAFKNESIDVSCRVLSIGKRGNIKYYFSARKVNNKGEISI